MQLIAVQQWVQEHMQFTLPLLTGMFVVVSSTQQQQQQQQLSKVLQMKCGCHSHDVSSSCNRFAAAVATTMPWRLRQVSDTVCGGVPWR
jgi:hypothetical protein